MGGTTETRLGAIALLVIGCWLGAAPPRAEAQNVESVVLAVAIPVGIAGLGTVALSIADVVSFATGSPWDDTAAAIELTIGTLVSLVGIGGLVYWGVVDPGVPGIAGLGAVTLALGTLHVAHAGWSFASNDAPSLAVRLSPIEGGAIAGMTTTF